MTMFIASPDCESRAAEAEMNFILVERVAKQKALALIEKLKVRCAAKGAEENRTKMGENGIGELTYWINRLII